MAKPWAEGLQAEPLLPETTQHDKVHPVAALFPMMSDEELDDLAEDIKTNGQVHPIIYDRNGQLIDGRNRLEACKRAGVNPRTDTLADSMDPVTFILSANISRRHLSKGQAAMAAAMARKDSLQSTRELASSAGTSHQRIHQASTVLQHAAELADAVLSGALSLDAAYQQARGIKQAQENRDETTRREQMEREAVARRADQELSKLRAEAPDFADLVIEERMSLREAQAAFKQRQDEDISERRALSSNLAMVLASLDPGKIGVEAMGRHFLRADASLVGNLTDFSAGRIRAAIAVLTAWLHAKEGKTDEPEAA